jgi:hypothetical protein
MFDGLLAAEADPEAMLAVRVGFSGSTSLHGRLQTDSERFVAELHSLATERGGDRLWVERVELRTRPLRAETMPDGPFHEVVEIIEQLRSNFAGVESVVEELSELKRKLPAELIHDPDGPHLDDAQWLQALLDHVQPLLFDLLTHSESVDAT